MNRFGLPDDHTTEGLPEMHERILIVDDEPRMRASLRELLSAPNRIIQECPSGIEAIAALVLPISCCST